MAIGCVLGEPKVTPEDATITSIDEFGKPVTIRCDLSQEDGYEPVQWYHGEDLIQPEAGDENPQYTISAANNSLTVNKAVPADVGEYTCVFKLFGGTKMNATVSINALPFVHKFDKSKNLVQGDPLDVQCQVDAFPTASVTWYKDQEKIEPSDRIEIKANKDGLEGASLRITNMDFDDRADYVCVATNMYGTNNSTLLVRVKDKLAALWPFLGICAEVTILVIIIFIYERRRAKKLEEMDEKEEAERMTNSHQKGAEEVRHRK